MIEAPFEKEKKAGPPTFLAAIVGALTPRKFRRELKVGLVSNYTNVPSYCMDAARKMYRAASINVPPAFNRTRLTGDLACVFIAFYMLPVAALAGILLIAALTLLWRDGHTYPPDTSAGGAASDALVLGAGLVAWQLFCLLAANSLVAPRIEFLLGLPFAMAMVAAWRFKSRWEAPRKPTRSQAERAYREAWRVYLLWIAAVYALLIGNTRIVVGGNVRDFCYVLGSIIPFLIAARMQSKRIGGGVFDYRMIWFGKDLEKAENAERAARLFSKRMKTWSDFSTVHVFEGLFFMSMALGILIVPVAVRLGKISPDTVNWWIFIVDAAVFITLSRMWIELKKIHERVAAVLVPENKVRRYI